MDGGFHVDLIEVLVETYGKGLPADGQKAQRYQPTASVGWPRFSLAVRNMALNRHQYDMRGTPASDKVFRAVIGQPQETDGKMQITTEDIRAVKQLTSRDEFKQIVDHCPASPTILGILQDAFHENVISRMLRFLCDTSETHELGDRFVRQWLKSIPNCPFKLGRGNYQINAYFNWLVRTQSATNRYIDLVLVLNRIAAKTTAVLGVETKMDAPESERQIEDYQRGLYQRFQHVTDRNLLYLTPDGKANRTGKSDSGCACYDVSYESIITACNSLIKNAQVTKINEGRTRILLEDLSQFLSRDAMRDKRRSQIDQLLRELEEDRDTARALDVLRGFRHRTTIRTFVYEQLLPKIRKEFNDVEVEWHYPNSSAKPKEFNFVHGDIQTSLPKGAQFRIYYMLHSAAPEPTSGNSISLLLMAYSTKGRKFGVSLQTRFNSLRENLPEPEGELRQWGPWMCLWASAEHRLGEFNADEADELAQLYARIVAVTKPVLLRRLKKS
jgi:PD-(D/E)XK nuclease superfamily